MHRATVMFADMRKKTLFGVLEYWMWIKYHAVSSFAHFIECAAKEILDIGLMPVAMFFPAYLFLLSHGFTVLLLCFCYRFYSYLLLNLFSLFFCFHFILPPWCAATLHLFWYLCCCLSLSQVFLFAWTYFFNLLLFPLSSNPHSSKVMLLNKNLLSADLHA